MRFWMILLVILVLNIASVSAVSFTLTQTRTDSRDTFFNGADVLDIDNDGDLDVAVASYLQNAMIYENDGLGNYSIKQTFTISEKLTGTMTGDIDRDGDLDLYFANDGEGGRSQFVYENIAGTFFQKQNFSQNQIYALHGSFGDINSDGALDVVVGGGHVSPDVMPGKIYLNDGSGTLYFYDNVSKNLSEIDAQGDMPLADFDNDGDLDIFTVSGESGGIPKTPNGIFLNDGNGNFSLHSTTPFISDSVQGVAIADIDGDNYQDIVITYWTNSPTTIFRNDGSAYFTIYSNLSDSAIGGRGLSIADMDNDGDNDLIVSYNARDAIIYLNDGNGNFVKDFETIDTTDTRDVHAVDVNNDSKLDFVIITASQLKVYKSTIASTNTQPSAPTLFNSSYSNGKLTLSWVNGSDWESPNLLMYNLRVGTIPGAQDIVSGVYGTPMKGNMQQRSSITLNIPNQDYYWSVQTIDSGLKASAWSSEQVYSLLNNIPEKIVFVSTRDANYEIYTINPNGSNEIRLTTNSAADMWPVWSPDRTKIAFQSDRDGNHEIYVMNADGSSQTRLTNNLSTDYNLAWSPDGTKIVFRSQRDGNDEIYVMDADGSAQTRLTDNPASDQYPAWSPDGTKIVFYSNRDVNEEIYVMDADGNNQTRLTNNPAIDANPDWSPDGTKIAFGSNRDGNYEIYVMDADGSNQIRLTDNIAGDEHPRWSPDGSMIVFYSDRDGNLNIYAMDAYGNNQNRVTDNPSTDAHAHWATHSTLPPNTPPIHTTPILSSTFATNLTSENLTCLPQNLNDVDGDPITTIFNWYKNSNSLTELNMPFDYNTKDYSGNNPNGSITGASWATGKYGKALSFSGTDYVTVGDISSFKWLHGAENITDFKFTVSLWVQINNPESGVTQSLISTEGGSSSHMGTGIWYDDNPGQGTRRLRLTIFNGIGAQYVVLHSSADNAYPDDSNWHFLTVTYDHSLASDNAIIYLDGNEVSRGNKDTGIPSISDSTYNLNIGSLGSGSEGIDGKIDDVRIYKKVLSPEQIAQSYIGENKIVSQETDIDEQWSCEVTPNDGNDDGTTLLSNNILVLNDCTPSWTPDVNACQIDDQQLITYTDTNICGTTDGLPGDNGTYVGCDYCTPSWNEVNTSCQPSNEITGWYDDTNTCYAITGLPSDNNPPANNTYSCNYASPAISIGSPQNIIYNISTIFFNITAYDLDGIDTIWFDLGNSTDYFPPTTLNLSEGEYNLTAYANDTLGNINSTSINFSIILPDSDGDGIPDDQDNVIGNESDINSTIPDLNLSINGSTNLSQVFEGVLHIEFKQAMETFVEFDYNFSEQILNLSNIFLNKQNGSSLKGYVMVAGLNIGNETKTIYMDNVDTQLSGVCIKDVDITNIDEITPNCKGFEEYFVPCNGNEKYGYTCTENGTQYRIDGLKHTGIIQDNYCELPSDSLIISQNMTFCPGNYTLNGNMTINESNTILDCNGANIIGSSSGYGIRGAGNIDIQYWMDQTNGLTNLTPILNDIAGFLDSITFIENVTIKNCKISNYENGINLTAFKNLEIKDTEFFDNDVAITGNMNYLANIHNNIIHSNTQGIFSIAIDSSIHGNTAYNNEKQGIIDGGINNNNFNNKAYNNEVGILGVGYYNNLFNNNASGNTGYGIGILWSNSTGVFNNTANNNKVGVGIADASDIKIYNNIINNNKDGISVSGFFSQGTLTLINITNNTANDNSRAGILLSDGTFLKMMEMVMAKKSNKGVSIIDSTIINNNLNNIGDAYDFGIIDGQGTRIYGNIILENNFNGTGIYDQNWDNNDYCGDGIDNYYEAGTISPPGICAPNIPPTSTILSPINGSSFYNGTLIDLLGGGTDIDGNISAFRWSSDVDGCCIFGQNKSFIFPTIGLRTITLTVNDTKGAEANDSITLNILPPNNPPAVSITNPTNGSSLKWKTDINFIGSATDVENVSTSLSVVWWSNIDGILNTTSPDSSGVLYFIYDGLTKNEHMIGLNVTDPDGLTSTTYVVNISVTPSG